MQRHDVAVGEQRIQVDVLHTSVDEVLAGEEVVGIHLGLFTGVLLEPLRWLKGTEVHLQLIGASLQVYRPI